ncbi:unnamed protein product [Amoebophrya sp. A120]|nr:unnamed protein product [Amoebophrya sp. A120]|eukprot:GSA120T00017687001.1
MYGGGMMYGGGYGGYRGGMNMMQHPGGQGPMNGQVPLDANGNPKPPVPQFSTRAMVRFLMECAAVIQGTALVFVTVNSWLQSQTNATGEGGPLKQLWTIVKSVVFGNKSTNGGNAITRGTEWAKEFVQRQRHLEREFYRGSGRQFSWVQSLLLLYLVYSLVSEFRNYLRLQKLPVKVLEAAAARSRLKMLTNDSNYRGTGTGRPGGALPGPPSASGGGMTSTFSPGTASSQQPRQGKPLGGPSNLPTASTSSSRAAQGGGPPGGTSGFSSGGGTTLTTVEKVGKTSVEVEVNHANGDQEKISQYADFYFKKQQEMKEKREKQMNQGAATSTASGRHI